MIPIDHPQVEILEIVACPNEDMWQDFDLTYHGLLSIINRLDQGMELDEEFDENQIYQLRDAVVELAQLGSLETSSEESQLLNWEIISLLFADQIGGDHCHFAFDPYSRGGMTNVTCGIRKTIKHIAHKIAKFIKKHKKEILIGTATAVGIAVAAKTISSNHARRHHYAPPPPPPPMPVIHCTPEPLSSEEVDEEIEEEWEDLTFESDEIQVPNSVINQHDPTIIQLAKHLGAEAAHEAWDTIVKAAPAIVVIPTRIALGDTWANKKDTLSDQIVPKVHSAIDEFFEQNISFGEKQLAAQRFATGTPPLPFFALGRTAKQWQKILTPTSGKVAVSEGMLLEKSTLNCVSLTQEETIKEIKKVAQIAEGCFANVAASEAPLLERSTLNNIRVQSSGIWEIGGENIKRFNLEKMLDKNRIRHIFEKPEHHLEQLEHIPLETYEKLTKALVTADRAGKIPINQPFEIHVRIDNSEIVVRGIVIEGELRYSTFFIPEKR